MTAAGIARVRASFEKLEEVFPIGCPESSRRDPQRTLRGSLPQMPQLPQPKTPARRVITDEEDAFEERAAIIEYDGGLPRLLAEFLARRGRGQ
jgi:hypothetical protein